MNNAFSIVYNKNSILEAFIEFLDYDFQIHNPGIINAFAKKDMPAALKLFNIDLKELKKEISVRNVSVKKTIHLLFFHSLINIRDNINLDNDYVFNEALSLYIKEIELLRKQICEYLESGGAKFGSLLKTEIDINVRYKIENNKPIHYINFHSIKDFVLFCFYKIVLDELELNQCQNCGRFFIPSKRKSEIYCDRVLPNGRTCKQVGYENKINSDDIMKEYRKAYKTRNAIKNRNKLNSPNAEADFKRWVYKAKEYLEKCKAGEISLAEYKELLKQ